MVGSEVMQCLAGLGGLHLDHGQHDTVVDHDRRLSERHGVLRLGQIHRHDSAEVLLPSYEPVGAAFAIGHVRDHVFGEQSSHRLQVD
jgi:hypothetical protein